MDRGSWQSMGIITDVGLFIRELAELLAPDEVQRPSEDEKVRLAASRTLPLALFPALLRERVLSA